MKECPNCGEMLGDTMEVCFNCSYNFKYGQVVRKGEEKQAEKEIKERKALQEQEAEAQRLKNPLYEYKTVVVYNLADGQVNLEQIQAELDAHAKQGWRLHLVFNNELGKTSSAVTIGFMGSSVNATIDQTVIIFERCIKAGTN